jgi:ATP adenylyltransferase
MAQISEVEILATFDQLVSEGAITFGPYETIKEDCDGYPVGFSIL